MTKVRLTSPSKQKIPLIGVIKIFVQIVDLKVRVCFGVIQVAEVSATLAASFVDQLITGIYPTERKIVSQHSRESAILAASTFLEEQLKMVDEQKSFTVMEESDEMVDVDQ